MGSGRGGGGAAGACSPGATLRSVRVFLQAPQGDRAWWSCARAPGCPSHTAPSSLRDPVSLTPASPPVTQHRLCGMEGRAKWGASTPDTGVAGNAQKRKPALQTGFGHQRAGPDLHSRKRPPDPHAGQGGGDQQEEVHLTAQDPGERRDSCEEVEHTGRADKGWRRGNSTAAGEGRNVGRGKNAG